MSGLEKIRENNPVLIEEEMVEENSGQPSHAKFRNKVLEEFDAENKEQESQEFKDLYVKAQQLYLDKNDDEALQCYVQAATIARYDGFEVFQCYKNIGNILLRIGDLSNAESFYLKAYTINPDSDTLLVNFGTLEMQKEDYDKALERYRAAVQINPENERGWVGLAIIHREYGDQDLAWANIQKALDICPSYLIAMDLAFEWGIKDSRFESLVNRALAYLHLEPDDHYIRIKLAKAYICCRRIKVALNEINRVLEAEPDHQDANELLKLLTLPVNNNKEPVSD